MTEPFDEYGDRLRRALQAEADAVTPDPDALDHIRAKISTRDRRFRFWLAVPFPTWLSAPWLRPVAALGAAAFIAIVAATATPAIENLTSTGQSTQPGGGPGHSISNGNGHNTRGPLPSPGTPSSRPGSPSTSPSTKTSTAPCASGAASRSGTGSTSATCAPSVPPSSTPPATPPTSQRPSTTPTPTPSAVSSG